MEQKQRVSRSLTLQLALFLLLCLCQTHSAPFIDIKESLLMETKVNAVAPDISPSADSQPFLPLLAPSPLTPFTNTTVPKLSVCPLVFPNMTNVVKECGNVINNRTACCKAMESYVSQLQQQSFLTNLQALNCAASLGMKLQKANVSDDVYNLCHINLKDFSLQVGSQESGCLLPSLPSDATYDKTSGIGFVCDLNDNIGAPWPSKSYVPASTCNNKTANLPALPTATSAQSGRYTDKYLMFPLLVTSLLLLNMLH